MALKAELQIKKCDFPRRNTLESSYSAANKGKAPETSDLFHQKSPGSGGNTRQAATTITTGRDAPRNTNPYVKPTGNKCYRCGKPGHHSNNCPECKIVNLVEHEKDYGEQEVGDEGNHDLYDNCGELDFPEEGG
ncbi:zf-CCHC domain-containing protein [Cephalotus follicularis]|uniref:Zf-CCHC domain-containing protein n=1 Tax=Cephalotus follicularis TaxID=3775 RepID=A0A1Q3CQB9_CEPFO|nr:zf-CCHC domain-containing protein [Cephalotus follicularis]